MTVREAPERRRRNADGKNVPVRRHRFGVGNLTVVLSQSGAYFNEEGNFEPALFASDLVAVLGLTRGPGGGLWFDAGGVYRPDAEKFVADLTRRVLGDGYRANRGNEVMAYCKTLFPEVTTDPPPENVLNVANGVLDLDTLELRPVADDERFMYQLPIAWNPDARCPAIEEFLREVLPADARWLAVEILGVCLLPTARYRRAVMLVGAGSNGKSVFLGLLRRVLGVENVASVTLHALSEDRFSKAKLFGKLANVAGDLDARPVQRSDAFKMLTGGDLITAEHKFGQPFQFVSYATLIFSANEWPTSFDQTDAYFTRWLAIPFDQRYRENGGPLRAGERRADPTLPGRLTTPAELEGLLVLAVKGARRLRGRGHFTYPESTRRAVEDYRRWADTISAWMSEAVAARPGHVLTRGAVYAAYATWCVTNGQHAVSAKRFWPKFREQVAEAGIEMEEYRNNGMKVRDIVVDER